MLIISTHCSFLCLPLQIIDLQVFKVPYHIFVFFSIGSIALVCFMNGKREHSMGKYSYKIEHTLILSWKYNFFEALKVWAGRKRIWLHCTFRTNLTTEIWFLPILPFYHHTDLWFNGNFIYSFTHSTNMSKHPFCTRHCDMWWNTIVDKTEMILDVQELKV